MFTSLDGEQQGVLVDVVYWTCMSLGCGDIALLVNQLLITVVYH